MANLYFKKVVVKKSNESKSVYLNMNPFFCQEIINNFCF